MIKRSVFPAMVLGLLGSLMSATPSQAGSYIVSVSETFALTSAAPVDNSISTLTLQFSGLTDGISSLQYVGTAWSYPVTPTSTPVTPTLTGDSSAQTVTLSFSPNVFTASGTVTFDTIVPTNNIAELESTIKFVSGTSGASTSTFTGPTFTFLAVVPEPNTMALGGIGMACLLAFHRLRKRFAAA
jgi:hypothetical protein